MKIKHDKFRKKTKQEMDNLQKKNCIKNVVFDIQLLVEIKHLLSFHELPYIAYKSQKSHVIAGSPKIEWILRDQKCKKIGAKLNTLPRGQEFFIRECFMVCLLFAFEIRIEI